MKKTNKKQNINPLWIVLAISFVVFIFLYYFYQQKNSNPVEVSYPLDILTITIAPTGTQMYESKFMKFSITIPEKFKVKTNTSNFMAIVNDEGEMINIIKSATFFKTLEEYIDDLIFKNKSQLVNKRIFKIGRYPVIVGNIDKRLVYFIYIDNWVYSFSTSSESLYDELDQIAHSFKYLP